MNKGIEPDKKHLFWMEKINKSVARKRAFYRVAVACEAPFNTRRWIADLGLCSDKDLEIALETGFIVELDGAIILTGKALTPDMWRDPWLDLETSQLLDEPRITKTTVNPTTNLVPPVIKGCKCRNSEQVDKKYWLFTGWEQDGIKETAKYLQSIGIDILLQKNGDKGNYLLILPLWITGEVVIGAESHWKEIEEENLDVINSITIATKTSVETSGNCLSWLQGEAPESLTNRT